MSKKKDHPDQLALAFYTPPVVIPQGDGSVLVKPGKPTHKLKPREFGAIVGLDEDTIYKYMGSEALPEQFVKFAGKRKKYILAEAIEHWETYWKRRRGAEAFAG